MQDPSIDPGSRPGDDPIKLKLLTRKGRSQVHLTSPPSDQPGQKREGWYMSHVTVIPSGHPASDPASRKGSKMSVPRSHPSADPPNNRQDLTILGHKFAPRFDPTDDPSSNPDDDPRSAPSSKPTIEHEFTFLDLAKTRNADVSKTSGRAPIFPK